MARILLRSFLFGLLGFLVTPVVVFFTLLLLFHAFDPRCGAPGDSGGCEMGTASIAIASALPGFLVFFLVPLIRGLERRARSADN